MRWLLFLALPLLAASVHNGQTFITPFEKSFSAPLPATTIADLAILPIDYHEKARTITLTIDGLPYRLTIIPKSYPKELLHVPKHRVRPPKALRERIHAEYTQAMRLYAKTTPKSSITKPFILPLSQTIVTSPFGTARLFNGTLKSYHTGTDFKAAIGTPVMAANDGVVVLAKERYFAGKSIIIDHGKGIYSCYYHLSRFNVHVGDRIKRGEVIGYSGKSGRVTGPHLHFAIRIRGIAVDPIQFIETINPYLERNLDETDRSPPHYTRLPSLRRNQALKKF